MKNTKRNELAVCGFATVKKLEKNHPEKIRRLFFTEEKFSEETMSRKFFESFKNIQITKTLLLSLDTESSSKSQNFQRLTKESDFILNKDNLLLKELTMHLACNRYIGNQHIQ